MLRQLTSPVEAADIVLALAGASNDEIHNLITNTGFQKLLSRLRGLPDNSTILKPSNQYRIRIRVDKDGDWSSTGEIALIWITAAKTLLSQLGHTFRILRDPHDPSQFSFDVFTSSLDVPSTERYLYRKSTNGQVGTFDIWCATTCDAWGSPQDSFPYSDQAVSTYFSTLELEGIKCDCRESWPSEIILCVALVGSDHRDNSTIIFNEYMARLHHRTNDNLCVPPFQIIWASIRPPTPDQSIMTKSVACLPQHIAEVLEAFGRLQRSTVTSFWPVTNIYSIYPLPTENTTRVQALTDAALAQRSFLDGCIRAIVTGIGGIDPHTFQTQDSSPKGTPCSFPLIEQIFHGTVVAVDGKDIENPIMKVTTDPAFNRYYLTAHRDDAKALIKYS